MWLAAAAFICYGGTTIFELGFYSDDWEIIQAMEFSGRSVPASLLSSFQQANAFRPLMALHWLVPHALFGVDLIRGSGHFRGFSSVDKTMAESGFWAYTK